MGSRHHDEVDVDAARHALEPQAAVQELLRRQGTAKPRHYLQHYILPDP